MANEIADQTNESTGILKDYYDVSPMSEALRKKRKKLAETQIGLDNEDKE